MKTVLTLFATLILAVACAPAQAADLVQSAQMTDGRWRLKLPLQTQSVIAHSDTQLKHFVFGGQFQGKAIRFDLKMPELSVWSPSDEDSGKSKRKPWYSAPIGMGSSTPECQAFVQALAQLMQLPAQEWSCSGQAYAIAHTESDLRAMNQREIDFLMRFDGPTAERHAVFRLRINLKQRVATLEEINTTPTNRTALLQGFARRDGFGK
jgi:hypothetical protein